MYLRYPTEYHILTLDIRHRAPRKENPARTPHPDKLGKRRMQYRWGEALVQTRSLNGRCCWKGDKMRLGLDLSGAQITGMVDSG